MLTGPHHLTHISGNENAGCYKEIGGLLPEKFALHIGSGQLLRLGKQ